MVMPIHFFAELGSLIPKIENTKPNAPKLPPTIVNKSANPSQAAGDGKIAMTTSIKIKQLTMIIEQ